MQFPSWGVAPGLEFIHFLLRCELHLLEFHVICISPHRSKEQARHLSGKSPRSARWQISNRLRPVRDAMRIARDFSAGLSGQGKSSPIGTAESLEVSQRRRYRGFINSVVPDGTHSCSPAYSRHFVPGYCHAVPLGRPSFHTNSRRH